MSLPSKSKVLSFDYSPDGSPTVLVAASTGIVFNGLDYSADGSPFHGTKAKKSWAPFPMFFNE